jgi:hypothetical protein
VGRFSCEYFPIVVRAGFASEYVHVKELEGDDMPNTTNRVPIMQWGHIIAVTAETSDKCKGRQSHIEQ